jgi:hypothetical protein
MEQIDVAVIVGAAAAGAALVVVGFMRGSRTPDEGLRRLRLLLNVILLGFYYATFGVALALFGLGVIHHDTNYWFGAVAFLLVALLLFRDMSATRSNPLREWFSRAPMSERVRGLQEDTRSLLRELSDEKGSEGSPRDDSVAAGHASGETRADGTRTWTFEFHWPPRKRGS